MKELLDDPSGKSPQFSEESQQEAAELLSRYPQEQRASALLPLLHLAQREFGGWLSRQALDYVASYIGMPPIRVYEVATFYTMYNLSPVGRYHIQVCTNISCAICSAEMVMDGLYNKLKLKPGQSSSDGRFTIAEVECLGACVNAPVMQINDDYYEHLTAEKVAEIIDRLP